MKKPSGLTTEAANDSREEQRFVDGPDYVSLSELFHENSKQRRYDVNFGRRIGQVNNDPTFQRLISKTFKSYPGALTTHLPKVEAQDGISLEKTVVERRSIRRFSGQPIALAELARLLYFGNGLTGGLDASAHGIMQPVRAAPSAGALFPTELYVVLPSGGEITSGLYHYCVARHALELLKTGEFSGVLADATSDQATFSRAAATIVMTSVLARSRFKYGERGYRFALIEVGHLAQNVLLAAHSLRLGAVPIGGFIDDEINDLLDIDGIDEAPVYLLPIGRPASRTLGVVDNLLEMLWTSSLRLDHAG
jgi:SagB-type dehydrogenase family enzyme